MDLSEAMRVNRALNKMSKLYREAKTRRLAALGLHPGQDVLLWLLAGEAEGMTISRLAARLGIEPPTATRSVARLEGGGWFRREPVPGDRRQVRIVATEAGRALVPEIERVWAELAEDALGPVPAAGLDAFLNTLEEANDRLRALIGDEVLADG
ncbi:MarR family transcriptional regulator [Allokutzneria sp. A3M-2-11 16]|uniref:MarR family winged helix-turn-helix transcriptional regulator n=1 Tax=Allokutzneria sp. A3M-2-11 16 TaxID=2962043 RepID=UPI0020B8D336|nr:MarR family transcriptional regulator [Allokutzneria sp. A3M-2-11 16]MCP3803453.1 MarR family transcriptional regulator [Allokutzneria sp. A3M-2-11 16]